jgi:Kef-type K+ transport system membrane component KefB
VTIGTTEVLAIVALSIIIAPTISGLLRLPGIIGFVLAGALVGPFVLGWLPEGSVDGIGKIGLLYLMFQAGLEIDMATFKKYRSSAIIFGLLTFTFPFVAGMAEGWFILGFEAAAAVLIGSIWASHTLVTLPEVREAGLSANPAVTATAGATVITDTLALVVLAVVTAEGGSTPLAVLLMVLAGLVTMAIYAFLVLPWVGARFFRGTGQERALRFAFLLFAMASTAVIAEAFGIEGLVGAFLAGLGVNRLVPSAGPLMERVDFFGGALFVPAFLIYVGTKLNPAVVFELPTVEMALLFTVALIVGKGGAALVGGRTLRFSSAETGLMFGMTVPQAAATLAATLVGAEVGLFDERVVNAVVIVVLVSILTGSLVTRRYAARVEMPSGVARPLGAAVIVGLPREAAVEPLVRIAAAIAGANDGVVLPVAVAAKAGEGVADAERVAALATGAAEAVGADVEARVRFSASYAEAMLEAIVDRRASALVVPFSLEERLLRGLFATDVDRIGRESPVPVIGVRVGEGPFTKVVLALDQGSSTPADRHDQHLAVAVAEALGQRLRLPITVAARDEDAVAALGLHEVAAKVLGPRPLVEHPEVLTPGSVLVAPASLVRRAGPFAGGFAREHADVTTVVAAGPHRLRTPGGAASSTQSSLVGGGRIAAADAAAQVEQEQIG